MFLCPVLVIQSPLSTHVFLPAQERITREGELFLSLSCHNTRMCCKILFGRVPVAFTCLRPQQCTIFCWLRVHMEALWIFKTLMINQGSGTYCKTTRAHTHTQITFSDKAATTSVLYSPHYPLLYNPLIIYCCQSRWNYRFYFNSHYTLTIKCNNKWILNL